MSVSDDKEEDDVDSVVVLPVLRGSSTAGSDEAETV